MGSEVNGLGEVCNVYGCHRAITGEMLRCFGFNLLHHGSGNLNRFCAGLFLHSISPIVTGTTFNGVNLGVHHKIEDVPGFVSYFLNPQMTRDLIADVAKRIHEIKL